MNTQIDDIEQSPQPQSEQPVKVVDGLRPSPQSVVERPKVYNLRNKKTVANNLGMKISLFDKSFERDQL